MRWLVTGAAGMLGTDLVRELRDAGDDVVAVTRADLDVRDPAACRSVVQGSDVVVNAAAWTDVDGAESSEADAFAVNAVGAANLARACAATSAVMVQVSTDYVFAGDASAPYEVDSPLDPLNAYGRTKAAAEWAVRAECPQSYVVRTAWLYGEHGSSFPATMLRLAGERDTLDVVDDQRGQPTWTVDLARFLRSLVVDEEPFGIRHGTATGETTWCGFAREIFSSAGLDPDRVRPTTSDRYPRPAPRPAYSVLDNGGRLPKWEDALHRAMPGLTRP
jgi:dTDP-4-dehydrorhamnose reductase